MRSKHVPLKFLVVLGCLLMIVACMRKDLGQSDRPIAILMTFPELVHPEGNEYTEARWELGRKLFFDPVLSIDSTLSCAGCHKPSLAFSDSVPFSPGVHDRPGTRNAPSLANVAYHPYFLKEGGVPTLEMQVLVPIQEHNEFAHNIVDIAMELQQNEEYVAMSFSAYGREPDPFIITRSLSVFERTLISDNSQFDQYIQGERSAMTKSQVRGMDLFFSDHLACSSCHSGSNFTNYAFENNVQDTTDGDIGRMRVTKELNDKYLFKVPSLRNVSLTGPYMHDGRYASIAEVVEHYDKGGQANGYPNEKIKTLGLTKSEKRDLIAFLQALTDESFVTDARWAQ